jgi:hypothetical protein
MRSTQSKLPSSVWGQIRTLLFQPEIFFKSLTTSGSAWLLIAILLMLLTGVSEVRRLERLSMTDQDAPSSESGPPLMDVGSPMDPMGGGVPLPPTDGGGGDGSSAPSVPVTQQLEQILGASGSIMAMWLLLMPLLALIPLFNGTAPRANRVVQVAIWSTLPLGLLALLQLVYYGAGGKAGEPGILGIVVELPFYASLMPTQQSLMLSLASRVTLFHGWMIAFIYLGARHTLRGKRIVVVLVIAAWIALIVALPVVTGAYHIEPVLPILETLPQDPSEQMPPEGGCAPSEMGTPDHAIEALSREDTPNNVSEDLAPLDVPPPQATESTDAGCTPSEMGTPDPMMEGLQTDDPNLSSDDMTPSDEMLTTPDPRMTDNVPSSEIVQDEAPATAPVKPVAESPRSGGKPGRK